MGLAVTEFLILKMIHCCFPECTNLIGNAFHPKCDLERNNILNNVPFLIQEHDVSLHLFYCVFCKVLNIAAFGSAYFLLG
jgi:hypothetical protein